MYEAGISPQDLLEAGQTIQIKPIGHSMYPLLIEGRDAVVVAPINSLKLKTKTVIKKTPKDKIPTDHIQKKDLNTTLRRGDVVLYRREESILVIHRIWKATKRGFYAVGDNQVEIEGPLDYCQIKGKMIAFVRNGKKISVKNPLYLLYSHIWLWLRPCRGKIGKFVHKLKTMKR